MKNEELKRKQSLFHIFNIYIHMFDSKFRNSISLFKIIQDIFDNVFIKHKISCTYQRKMKLTKSQWLLTSLS